MSVPEPSHASAQPAALEAARKQALLAPPAEAPASPAAAAAAPVARADLEATRKASLVAPSTLVAAPDEGDRKRALLRPPNEPATSEPPTPPSRVRAAADALRARTRSYSRRQLAGIGALAALVTGVSAYGLTRPPAPVPLTQRDVDQAVAKGIEAERKAQAAKPPEGEAVYAAIRPSLVIVSTERTNGSREGLGAGTVVKDDGTILTALHVVNGAARIMVQFADGTASEARLESVDGAHDIAVLSVREPPDLVIPAVLGGGVRVGDPVYALGHPLGLGGSFSGGVVSATGRTIRAGGNELTDLIQFDAAVNPGNSGGPLLNRRGEVVGVVTALANPTESSYFIGIGFAAPIASAGGAAGAPPQ
jgi:S1-C subfamily serine protease